MRTRSAIQTLALLGACALALAASAQTALASVITFDSQPVGSPMDFMEDGFTIDFLAMIDSRVDATGNPGHALSSYGDIGSVAFRVSTVSGDAFTFDGMDISLFSGVSSPLATYVGLVPEFVTPPNNFPQNLSFSHNTTGYEAWAPTASLDGVPLLSLLIRIAAAEDEPDFVHVDNIRLTIVPAPGAAALLALSGLVATRRHRESSEKEREIQ